MHRTPHTFPLIFPAPPYPCPTIWAGSKSSSLDLFNKSLVKVLPVILAVEWNPKMATYWTTQSTCWTLLIPTVSSANRDDHFASLHLQRILSWISFPHLFSTSQSLHSEFVDYCILRLLVYFPHVVFNNPSPSTRYFRSAWKLRHASTFLSKKSNVSDCFESTFIVLYCLLVWAIFWWENYASYAKKRHQCFLCSTKWGKEGLFTFRRLKCSLPESDALLSSSVLTQPMLSWEA